MVEWHGQDLKRLTLTNYKSVNLQEVVLTVILKRQETVPNSYSCYDFNIVICMNDSELFFSPLVLAFIYRDHWNVKDATIKIPVALIYSKWK